MWSQPAAEGLGRLLGPVPVAPHHVGTFDPQLAADLGSARDGVVGLLLGVVLGHDGHVAHGHGRPDAVRLGDVVGARVHGGDRGGLGQSVAVGGLADGPGLPDAPHQVGRGGRAAVGDAADRGGVELGEVGRVEHLHDHGRHAAEGGDPLALDQLERPLGIPVVHHDKLPAGGQVGDHDGVTAGGVEERHRQQVRGLGPFGPPVSSSGRGAEAHPAPGVEEEEAHQVGAHVAMRAHGALGPPGGARRVEDGGVVLRIDREVGRRGGLVHVPQGEVEGPLGHGYRTTERPVDGGRCLGRYAMLVGDDERLERRRGRPGRGGCARPARVSTKATLEPESSRP